MNKIISHTLLVVMFIFINFTKVECIRCMHCKSEEMTDGAFPAKNDDIVKGAIRLPTTYHASCAQGNIPDPNLSIDCSQMLHIILASLPELFLPKEIGEDERIIFANGLERELNNSELTCGTVFNERNVDINGTTHRLRQTIRSCFPKDRPFAEFFRDFDSDTNTTGYLCEDYDYCNQNDSPPSRLASVGVESTGNFYFVSLFVTILFQFIYA